MPKPIPFSRTTRFRRSAGLLWAAICVLAAGSGCANNSAAPAPSVKSTPVALKRLPDPQVVAEANVIHRELDPAAVVECPSNYLSLMRQRLLPPADPAYPPLRGDGPYANVQFLLVRDGLKAVTSAGGQYVYVSTGFLAACKREEDLAAAMCYALAHLALKHVEPDPGSPPEGGPIRQDASPVDQTLHLRFALREARPGGYFTPDQWRAADEVAYALYVRGGWDPALFVANPALAKLPAGSGRPVGQPAGSRQENVTGPRTFPRIVNSVAAMAPANEAAKAVLALLPVCYGDGTAAERAAARAALAERVKPPPSEAVPRPRPA
jgi:hypothetical protein